MKKYGLKFWFYVTVTLFGFTTLSLAKMVGEPLNIIMLSLSVPSLMFGVIPLFIYMLLIDDEIRLHNIQKTLEAMEKKNPELLKIKVKIKGK